MSHRIAFLIYPGFQLLDAAGPIAAFEVAERVRPGTYTLRVIAAQAGLVASSSGVSMPATAFRSPAGVDTLIVSGGNGSGEASGCLKTRRFIQTCALSARRTTSVCSGTFLLAAAASRVGTCRARLHESTPVLPCISGGNWHDSGQSDRATAR
jgi:transcriptional regulator GlxA family with amidase domain